MVAAIALIAPAAASAAGEPAISLEKHAPEQALLGTTQAVQLVVKNPAGQPRGYNLSFRDVLPANVTYVPGSSTKIAPRVIPDAPNPGEMTLLFENVSDLSPGSEYVLAYEVEPSKTFFKIAEEEGNVHSYTNQAEAFIGLLPRKKPNFEPNGEVIPASVSGRDEAEATTELTAIEIEKEVVGGIEAEHELLRGVHEHQAVYQLTVKNSKVGETVGVVNRVGKEAKIGIEDYLPAGLEFLGCGTAENTTNAIGTNPGSPEEYPGSGEIPQATPPTLTNCLTPYYVKTEEVDPPGPQPEGIYTHVKWEGPASLPAGGEYKLDYVAAVPILRNGLTWAGPEPAAEEEGLGQIANLDDNQGNGETHDEEALTNVARAVGKYEKVTVQDTGELTVTAEDLAIQKTVDQGQIYDNARSIWSLRLETSEYRWDEPVSISDELPNGLCPLGTKDFEGGPGAPTEPTEECEVKEPAKFHPVVKYVKGGAKPAGTEEEIEYTLAEEQEKGGYKVAFDDSTVNALTHLEPSQELLITFPTATQTFYQLNFENDKAKPVLTGDSWTNHVSTEGEGFNRCYTEAGGVTTADPNCEAAVTNRIFPGVTTGIPVTDVSEASQEAGEVEIEKTVRENEEGLVPEKCEGPTSEYVKGLEGFPGGLPLYRPGDEICWRLVVKFAAKLYAGHPVVSDFIPTDEEYVQGSAEPTELNTIESTFNKTAAETEGALEWEVGKAGSETVEREQLFEWRFKTIVKATPSSDPGEISGNLMKFVYSNTEGETFPLRDRAEVERTEPALELKKSVLKVNGVTAGEGATVQGGDKVMYGIEIPNTEGTLKAEDIEVWDNLPAGIKCGVDIEESSISDSGECAGEGRIVWEGVEAGPGATAGPLTYVVKVPIDVAPGHEFENEAGITQFKSETNTGQKFTYFPEEDINPAVVPAEYNTGPARDAASVVTTGASLAKTAKADNGNNEATIGEIVTYTVTATIPAGSTLYGAPAVTDTVPTGLEYVAGSAKASLSAGAGGEITSTTFSAGLITVQLGAPYVNPEGSGNDVVTITFEARVKDVAVNVRGTKITNHALFTFGDEPETGGHEVELPAQVTTPVTEPNLVVGKSQSTAPSGIVAPGDTLTYTVTATNSTVKVTNVSTANEVELKDTIPTGMELVAKTVKEEADEGRSVVGNTIAWKLGAIAPGATVTRSYQVKVEKPATAASNFPNTVTGTTQSLPDVGGVPPAGARTSTFVEGPYKAAEKGYESKESVSVRLVGAKVRKEVAQEEGTIGTSLTYTLHMELPPNITYFNPTVIDTLPEGVKYDSTVSEECIKGCEAAVEGELLPERLGAAGTTLVGWYFGPELAFAAETRELVVVFKAHVEDVKSGGEEVKAGDTLTNSVIGVYNEKEEPKPTEVPTPGASGFSEETEEKTASTEVVEPLLTLTKSVSANPALGAGGTLVEPASKLTYTLVVTNEGTSTAYDSEIEDTVPTANLRNIVVTPNGEAEVISAPAAGPIVWSIPELESGDSVMLTYTAELVSSEKLKSGELVENTAKIPVSFGLTKTERETAKAKRKYKVSPVDATVNVEVPDIELEKTAGTGEPGGEEATVGVAFPWHLIARNNSEAIAKDATVVDTLPEGWAYFAGTGEVGGEMQAPEQAIVGGHEVLTWVIPGPLTEVEIGYKAVPGPLAATVSGLNKAEVAAVDATGSPKDGNINGAYAATAEAEAEVLAPELKVVKTPEHGPLKAGEKANYTIVITNEGKGDANGVEVSDVLSPGQAYEGPSIANPTTGFTESAAKEDTPTTGVTTLGWTIAKIPAGHAVEITVPIRALPSLAENTTISDLAKASTQQELTPEGEDEGSFDVAQESDLGIHKTDAPETVNAGEDIEYTLEAFNNGPSDATGIVVTDELPEHTDLVEGSLEAGCTEAAGVVTCELAELKAPLPGQTPGPENIHSFQFSVEVEPGTKGEIENTATVTGDQPDVEHPENNESTAKTPLGGVAELSIVKTGPEAPVLLGQDFTYKLHVENQGPSTAFETEVADALPAQVKFVAATPSQGACDEAPGRLLTCELETMLPHTDATVEVEVEAAEVGAFENEGEVHSPVTDPDETNNHSEAPAEILPAADLALTKTAPATVEPNGEVNYKLVVEDKGPSTAHEVVVTDPLPAGTDFVKASEGCAAAGTVVTCEIPGGELEVGEPFTFQVTVHVPFALGGATVTNTASVTGEEGDPDPEDNSSSATTTVGPAADLSITKSMGRAEAGKPLVYTLAITNHGPSASSAVTVKDTLPAGTAFKSAAPSQGTCSASGQAVTCELGALASGGSAQVSITVEVAANATGTLRNVAGVEGPEPDPDKSNNESAVEGPVTPVPVDPVDPTGSPNLKVVKTADTSTPRVGVPFDYAVAISNSGDAEAKNVKVVDTLSGPVKVVAIHARSGKCSPAGSKIECTIPGIAVGKTVHVTYSVVAESTGSLSNTASAMAANGEKVPANNHAVKSVRAMAPKASFTLAKKASRAVVLGGQKVGFAITLHNGATAMTDAKVCDRLPAALVFFKAAGAAFVDGEACWREHYVAPHKVLRLHLIARAVKGSAARRAKNVASAGAANAKGVRRASATVRIKPVFGGAPGGVTG